MTTEGLPEEIRRVLLVDEEGRVDVHEFVAAVAAYARRPGAHPRDLVVAGQLTLRAWQQLRAESAELLARAEAAPAAPAMPADPWEEVLGLLEPLAEEGQEFRARVEAAAPGEVLGWLRGRPYEAPTRMPRRVTLMELVAALEAAQREADGRLALEERREARRARHQAARQSVVLEDPGRDQEDVLARLPHDGRWVGLAAVETPRMGRGAPERRVAALQAALHLAHAERGGVALVRQATDALWRVEIRRRGPSWGSG